MSSNKGRRRNKGKAKPPARPLTEYKERLEREKARASQDKPTFKQRANRLFPLFGIIGVAEIGLAVTLVGAIVFIWIKPHLWTVGLALTIAGLLITRYGADWLKRE